MSQTVTIETLDKRMDRIEKLLLNMGGGKKGSSWVRSSSIAAMTGWDKEKMRVMRENGVVKTRRIGKRYEYDAASVPVIFIRNTVV